MKDKDREFPRDIGPHLLGERAFGLILTLSDHPLEKRYCNNDNNYRLRRLQCCRHVYMKVNEKQLP